MATYDRQNWGEGFPFSPSPFKNRAVTGPVSRVNLPHARINDAHIPEGRPQSAPSSWGNDTQPFTDSEYLPAARPFAQRPIARQAGLRLLPLESFIWGSHNTQTRSRIRSDHTLIWLVRGFAQLGFPRRDETLAAGAVRFIPAGTAFSFSPRPEHGGYALLIAPPLIENTEPPFPNSYLAGNIGDAGEALLATLKELEAEGAKRPPNKALHYLLGVLALRLSRLTPPQRPAALSRVPTMAERPLAERFIALAKTRMQHRDTIADLAQELGTSAAALDHACLSAKGKRAIGLLYRLRFERAVEMLREGHHNPAQISQLLGYTSHTHFTRAFVEATGRRPESFQG